MNGRCARHPVLSLAKIATTAINDVESDPANSTLDQPKMPSRAFRLFESYSVVD